MAGQGIQGTTIHGALVRSHGFTGSYSSVRRFLAGLKAAHPQVTTVLEFDPGEAAQVDFGKGPEVLDPRTGELLSTWIFVMTLAWSRHAYAEVVTEGRHLARMSPPCRHLARMSPPCVRVVQRRACTPDHRQSQVRDHPGLLPRHPHSLRHTTAVQLLKANVDFATISQWLGHASVNTTMRYARADIDLKRAALSQVFPEALAPPKGRLAIDRADITGWLRAL